eukprot:gi/632982392/ref/XP_007908111.1/ PREDICTED: uncharacterized protein LOC103189495 [Callorhinchus milii]
MEIKDIILGTVTHQNKKILKSVFITLALTLLKAILETGFICPCDQQFNVAYGVSFFVFPAISLIIISFLPSPKECSKKKIFTTALLVLTWTTLLLLDGDYVICMFSTGTIRTDQPLKNDGRNPCKPPANQTIETTDRRAVNALLGSQLCGGLLLIVTLGICFIFIYKVTETETETTVGGTENANTATVQTGREDTGSNRGMEPQDAEKMPLLLFSNAQPSYQSSQSVAPMGPSPDPSPAPSPAPTRPLAERMSDEGEEE